MKALVACLLFLLVIGLANYPVVVSHQSESTSTMHYLAPNTNSSFPNVLVSNCNLGTSAISNAEVESAVDPSTGYIYDEWIGCGGIGFARSIDGGASFQSAITIPESFDGRGNFSWDPAIAVSSNGTIYAAFMLSSGNVYPFGGRPMVAISYDHGLSFSKVVSVAPHNNTEFSDRDFIAVSTSGIIYVTWDYAPNGSSMRAVCPTGSCYFSQGELNIVISHSSDGGNTWSPYAPVSPNFPYGAADSGPLLVEPSGKVDILYLDYNSSGPNHVFGPGHNYFVSSSNDGISWSSPVVVGAGGNRSVSQTAWWIDGSIARDESGNLYATFDTPNTTSDNAWISISSNGGQSWSNPVELYHSPDSSANIIAEVTSDQASSAYVTWMSNSSLGLQAMFQVFSNNGSAISPPIVVSKRGFNGIWGGDTSGIAPLNDSGVALSYGLGVDYNGNNVSEIFSACLYNLTVVASGSGDTSPSGTSWYPIGSSIAIQAKPSTGAVFKDWATSTPKIAIQNPSSEQTVLNMTGGGQITALFTNPLSTSSSSTTNYSATSKGSATLSLFEDLVIVIVVLIAVSAYIFFRRRL
ncbi:MAG: sialidase family protein [Nitrososphaerales archaeon]